jgi:hypothetical protein
MSFVAPTFTRYPQFIYRKSPEIGFFEKSARKYLFYIYPH